MSKIPIYVESKYQDERYWAYFLESSLIPTSAFYKQNNEVVMIQNLSEMPQDKVIWLEPYVLENGIASSIPDKEKPLFDLEWLEYYNS